MNADFELWTSWIIEFVRNKNLEDPYGFENNILNKPAVCEAFKSHIAEFGPTTAEDLITSSIMSLIESPGVNDQFYIDILQTGSNVAGLYSV